MVGDRVSTDIIGAKNAGIKSVLVKTGEFKESDLAGDVQPDYIVDSVGEIKKIGFNVLQTATSVRDRSDGTLRQTIKLVHFAHNWNNGIVPFSPV